MCIRDRTNATNTSVTTAATIHPHAEQKPWYKQPNPLRWGKIEPIPETRKPSPEHTAGFFNHLFFSWMGPLMSVSEPASERVMNTLNQPLTKLCRPGISDSWSSTIFTKSTQTDPLTPSRKRCESLTSDEWKGETSTHCFGQCMKPSFGNSGLVACVSLLRLSFKSCRPSLFVTSSSSQRTPGSPTTQAHHHRVSDPAWDWSLVSQPCKFCRVCASTTSSTVVCLSEVWLGPL